MLFPSPGGLGLGGLALPAGKLLMWAMETMVTIPVSKSMVMTTARWRMTDCMTMSGSEAVMTIRMVMLMMMMMNDCRYWCVGIGEFLKCCK